MSLEAKIEALTQVMTRIAVALESANVAPVEQVVQAPQPVVQAPVIVPVAAPAPAPVAAPAPVMPAAPTFIVPASMAAPASVAAPAPVAAPVGAPFNDGKGLIEYVMTAYKAMGAEKGAQIQGVLSTLGYSNINDVKPEHYSALYAGVEALK